MISLPASFTSQLLGGAGGNTPVMVVVAPQAASSKRVIGGVHVSTCGYYPCSSKFQFMYKLLLHVITKLNFSSHCVT